MPRSKNKRKNGKTPSRRDGFRATLTVVDEIQDRSLIERLPADVQKWIERYHAYICETCLLGYEAVDLDEGATPSQGPCLRTEGCEGVAISVPHFEHGPEVHSDDWPVLLEFYRPGNMRELRHEHPDVVSHVIRGGLMRRPSKDASKWVKDLING